MAGELEALGLKRGWIYETIVGTYNTDRKPNAAAMGASLRDSERLVLKPYLNTLTYRNIRERMCATVNVTSDPTIFYRAVYKSNNIFGDLPLDWFEPSASIDAPKLRTADAQIECFVEDIDTSSDRAVVILQPKSVLHRNTHVTLPYCRASSAVFESVLHSTRIRPFLREERGHEAEELINLINHYRSVVGKVAPRSELSEIMEDIQQKIHKWVDSPRNLGRQPRSSQS